MSLRSKILALFVTLALAPLLAVGISDYVQSVRLVARLVEANLTISAERAARAIGWQYETAEADLRALAEEYAARRGAGNTASPRWAELSERFDALEVRLASESAALVLKEAAADATPCGGALVRLEAPLARSASSAAGATLVGVVSVHRLLEEGALVQPFGRTGYTLLVDRNAGHVLYDRSCPAAGPAPARFEGEDGETIDAAALPAAAGLVRIRDSRGVRSASYVNLRDPAWTVVASTDLDEFTVPEGRARFASLMFVVFLALATAGAFAIMITHIMRSLNEVSVAAARIGEGDFTPWLPPPGNDEVGKLTLAVGAMVARLREMMGQLERSRQMAVVGELASHLSHEIRNPLSSIRLNLQSIDREVRRGEVPADLPVVLQLCLREITRLDRVVNNVLRLGRNAPGPARRVGMHALIDESLEVVQQQLAQKGVRVERRHGAADDAVVVDAEQLSGALLNLYLNAMDAMPEGGTLRVWTELAHDLAGFEVIRVHVADEGVGVSPELRERIFKPFFTTKTHGSGIGLPLSAQTAEAHGGRLYLEKRSELEHGAEFVLEIPLAEASDPDDSSKPHHRPKLGSAMPTGASQATAVAATESSLDRARRSTDAAFVPSQPA